MIAFKIPKLSLLFVFFLSVYSATAFQIPKKPSQEKAVYQLEVQALNSEEEAALNQKLIQYADSTSTQIVVIFVKTIGNQDIARFTTDLGQAWGVGQKGKDNGIVILSAIDDKKITIQVGRGSEAMMTDALSKRVIEQIIKPAFKQNQYYLGIDQATTAIFDIMAGEFKGKSNDNEGSKLPFLIILLVFMVIFILSSRGKGKGGNGGNRSFQGPDLMDILILSSLGRSSGGFGGGRSSGGFGGGFGGGSFGGGGASGSW